MLQAGGQDSQSSAWGELGEGAVLRPRIFPSSSRLTCVPLTWVQIQEALEEEVSSQKEANPRGHPSFPTETGFHAAEDDLDFLMLLHPPL